MGGLELRGALKLEGLRFARGSGAGSRASSGPP